MVIFYLSGSMWSTEKIGRMCGNLGIRYWYQRISSIAKTPNMCCFVAKSHLHFFQKKMGSKKKKEICGGKSVNFIFKTKLTVYWVIICGGMFGKIPAAEKLFPTVCLSNIRWSRNISVHPKILFLYQGGIASSLYF